MKVKVVSLTLCIPNECQLSINCPVRLNNLSTTVNNSAKQYTCLFVSHFISHCWTIASASVNEFTSCFANLYHFEAKARFLRAPEHGELVRQPNAKWHVKPSLPDDDGDGIPLMKPMQAKVAEYVRTQCVNPDSTAERIVKLQQLNDFWLMGAAGMINLLLFDHFPPVTWSNWGMTFSFGELLGSGNDGCWIHGCGSVVSHQPNFGGGVCCPDGPGSTGVFFRGGREDASRRVC